MALADSVNIRGVMFATMGGERYLHEIVHVRVVLANRLSEDVEQFAHSFLVRLACVGRQIDASHSQVERRDVAHGRIVHVGLSERL